MNMTVRIWAACAAIVFAVLLGLVAFATFLAPRVVVPQVSVKAAPTGEAGRAVTAQDVLAQRSRLQAEGSVASGARTFELDQQGPDLVMRDGVANGGQLVQMWKDQVPADRAKFLQPPTFRTGVTTLPYRESDVLVQPQGRDFRTSHNNTVRYGGGWLIFGTCLALALFLLGRGRIKTVEGESGEGVLRFNATERATHWMTATAFIVLALTGLIILYGKPLLIPVMGEAAFSTLAGASVWVHMSSAVPFVIGIVLMTILWLRGNLWTWSDWEWLKQGGGFLHDDGHNPPAARFNAGQKIVFWGVVLGGLGMLFTGLTLMFPFYWFGYTGMQWSQLVHAGLGLAMVALILGHIYIGSVGMEGAFRAMWSGMVDRNWAKEHHRVWFEQITRGRQ